MLDHKTYFTDENYIHSSQMKDYLESPELYKLRHIDKNPDYQFKQTPAVIVGTIADEILTEGKTKYALKVLKRDDEELFERQKLNPEFVATEAQWRDAHIIAEQLPTHPIWKQLTKGAELQKIVTGKIGGIKICGKLDGSQKERNWDLKCTSEAVAKNVQKWHWQCRALGYHIPAGVYTHLDGGDKPFYHLVCYIKSGILYVKYYQVPQVMIDDGIKDALRALNGIQSGNFDRKLCSMDDVEVIPWSNEEPELNDEEEEDGEY